MRGSVLNRTLPGGTLVRNVVPLGVNISVAMGVLLFSFSVYLTREAAGGEFSTSLLSLALAGSVVVRGLLAVPIGRYVDRFGIRRVVALGSLFGCAGLAAFSAATEPWHVIASWWLLIGAAGSMVFFEPAFVAVNQWIDQPERARALGALTVIGGASGVVFIPVSQWAVSTFGWRQAVLGLGLLLLASGALTVAFALPSSTRTYEPVTVQRRPIRLARLVRDRRLVLFTGSMMISAFAIQAVIAHRLALFEEAGIRPSVAAVWASIGTAISLPTRWYVPILSRHFAAWRLHLLGIVIVGLGTAFLVLPGSTTGMMTHFVVFGLAFATLLPLRALAMSDRFAGPAFGSIMGAQWMVIMFAGAAGPGIVGVVKQATGSYRLPMTVLVAMLGVSTVLIHRSEQGR